MLRGLDHPSAVGQRRSRPDTGGELCSTEDSCYSPVQSELTHRLQDVNLPGLSELLAPDAAHDKTTRPSYACAEVKQNNEEKLHYRA